jgi:transposase-like protein
VESYSDLKKFIKKILKNKKEKRRIVVDFIDNLSIEHRFSPGL